MNHPKPEEWVAYVYGEAGSIARSELTSHLHACAQCREEVETWKRSLKRLDTWKLPRYQRRRSELLTPVLQWAAAAALVLLAGIWIGRITSPTMNPEKLRAMLLPELRQALHEETAALVRQEMTNATSVTLASSQRYTDQVGQQVYLVLKKEVDTLAVNAENRLRNTAEQLVQLADYKVPQTQQTPNQ